MKSSDLSNPYIIASLLFAILIAMTQMFEPAEASLQIARSPAHVAADQPGGYFYLPVDAVDVSGIRQADYTNIIEQFFRFSFGEVYNSTGRPLMIPNEWNSPYFAAFAKSEKTYLQISLWGGFARAPGSTPAALIATLCHELGHILGGEPRQTILGGDWASSEGQSDFYAASICLPRFFKAHPEFKVLISEEVKQYCDSNEICEKTLQSGLDMARLLQKYSYREYTPVSLDTQAPAAEQMILNSYPSDQCRLDTFKVGALCQGGSCSAPSCWFGPQ